MQEKIKQKKPAGGLRGWSQIKIWDRADKLIQEAEKRKTSKQKKTKRIGSP